MTPSQAIGMGVLLMVISAPVLGIGWGLISGQINRGVPVEVVRAGGAVFWLAGLLCIASGLRQLVRRRRQRNRLLAQPDEPWFADYDWDPSSVYDDNFGRLVKLIGFSVVAVLLLYPFNWWAFFSDRGYWVIALITGFFDLIALCALLTIARRIVQLIKYGRSYVSYESFPLRLGAPARLRFGMRHDLRGFEQLQFTLRFVEEVFETKGCGDEKRTNVVPYVRWMDERTVGAADVGMGGEVEVVFDLPADPAYLTALIERPPRYWDLEVRASGAGVDYTAAFPLPVYLPPTGAVKTAARALQTSTS